MEFLPDDIFNSIFEEISDLINSGMEVTHKEELNIKKKVEVYWEVLSEDHRSQLKYELLPTLHDKIDPDAYEELLSLYELLLFKETITSQDYEEFQNLAKKGWNRFSEAQRQQISDLLTPLYSKIKTL